MNRTNEIGAVSEKSRFEILKDEIVDYLDVKDEIKTGIEDHELLEFQKNKILKFLGASNNDWNDYHWQLANRFHNANKIAEIIRLTSDETRDINKVNETYRYAVSPYYLSVIDPEDKNCPIKKQAIPRIDEMLDEGKLDPMDEKGTTVADIITRRYPDRLIIKVTNNCGMFCRFCQRRRLIGKHDSAVTKKKLEIAIEYIRQNSEIRDILLTGGDAFLISDEMIEWILKELRSINHVEIIRFGTRTPVTLPQRITKELLNIIKKYHPIFLNTHFNSPREITNESKIACEMLADAGLPLGNQMVLLNEVNNDPYVVRKLNQSLLKIRVKPYYIFHPKNVKGTKHFWVNIDEGLEIMESLRGRTSGLAIPTYIVNGPGGLGKTPMLPNYMLNSKKEKVVFRNWQNQKFVIPNE